MASILTSAIIVNTKSSVSTYVTTAQGLYDELQTLINNLTSSNFMGDASDGFKDFFNSKATPALVANLTEPGSSITAGLQSMLDSIKEQLLDTVDPQLGDINRDPTK
ncbi:hypothetical protein SAMN02910447_02290 [Ruminococcus sp. YE71]|uniref:hypothetical protein n=1 Tax=unclassified Ruminococcus TaxID=2608920 RepID=UPI00088A997F|nr:MULTISPECIES: hypothetical protein [unclassified Ruminococcus]SDA23138.1 hypothetical protein SAMN02910446_02157 [Ruminococcus sp. YE78]SFW39337.1 hypothetical protein SAMN02910447_02290 [Ruminococcus sp. YE71]